MDKICCIIDFEGFLVPVRSPTIPIQYNEYRFMLRELAYVRVDPHNWCKANSRFFDLRQFHWPLLDPESSRAIKLQENDIHGLSFWPTPEEEAVQELVHYNHRIEYLQALQKRCRMGPDVETIAFYSGPYEQELLVISRITALALDSYGCPDYESLLEKKPSYADITCNLHKNGKACTCPRARVTAFRDWWMEKYSKC